MGKPSLFSWVAIAVVVGVIAIVAIPADALYVPRQKMKEAVGAAQACQARLADFVARNQRLPRDAREAKCDESATARTSRTEVAGGIVKVTIRAIDPAVDGRFLSYQALDQAGQPTDGKRPVARWRCATDADLRHAVSRIIPEECRRPPG